MFSFAVDYAILVAVAFLGILQIVAARNQLKGLSFFSNKRLAYVFGVVVATAAVLWFFWSDNRNVEGKISNVEGAEQFWLFLVAVVSSVAVTLLLASIINRRTPPSTSTPRWGIDPLRTSTYIQLLCRVFKRRR